MKQYDTYIFDLDGTLLSTLGDLAASVNYALNKMNFPVRSLDEVRRFVGNGVRLLIARAVPEGTPEEIVDATLAVFKQHYSQHNLDTTCPYEGVIELLQELKQRGTRVAVVSNKFDAATKALCKYFFGDLIDVAVGENESAGVAKKPAPDTVIAAVDCLGVDLSNAVYIGDSEVDVLTARNCGIPCISVLWGFRDEAFLRSHGASVLVHAPLDILDIPWG